MTKSLLALACTAALLAGCDMQADAARPGTVAPAEVDEKRAEQAAAHEEQMAEATTSTDSDPDARLPFEAAPVATFNEPWALEFLPDGRMLVTEKRGAIRLFDPASGNSGTIAGVPDVDYGGQGGLGDVALHPQFADNGLVYISYVEAGDGDTRGAVVARARLALDASGGGALSDPEVVWKQSPKMSARGHYAHRVAFGPDGHLWISSGDRQHFDPAQDMRANLGKILRLNDDGSVPADNPFADKGGVTAQIWSLGHRNPLGIAFDAQGRLWNTEMGPAGGDELNLVERGGNYGYPIVSNGNHYDGKDIPDHGSAADTGFVAPKVWWTPVISPSGLLFYRGGAFADWEGNALIGGLSSQALVRVAIEGDTAKEVARYPMGQRIRAVDQGPDGRLWALEDGKGGRLLKLSPGR